MKLIKENDKAIIYQTTSDEFEVWIKLFYSVGKKKGELITPTDESFGVSAWSTYSKARAYEIFDEITLGKRGIRPMVEEV